MSLHSRIDLLDGCGEPCGFIEQHKISGHREWVVFAVASEPVQIPDLPPIFTLHDISTDGAVSIIDSSGDDSYSVLWRNTDSVPVSHYLSTGHALWLVPDDEPAEIQIMIYEGTR